WPADGTIVGRFVAGEPTKQGVDIAGRECAPVRAAADGTVVYSGAGLVGYGELVIIKHSDQWLSAYGHNRKRLVNEGQLVKAGQTIAEMGHSGAPRDMLHFEIRYTGKPVDPLLYLPPR
ncbi:MAG TPA: peptidoglycan DD-metalloendopeptidase family protein, partial [Lysobacter sp.]|nr:peptidoglycan DD-metalloendopeptidase family protein [Lysobacter sp.]